MSKEILDHLELTKNIDPKVRLNALKIMCPCRIKDDIDLFWNRIFEMADDEDKNVRYQVLHTICDGSPNHLEDKVFDAIDKFNRDKDGDIRRRAHKVMASYKHTGKWNIL